MPPMGPPYIFGCKRNTAISANKPKYTFVLLTSAEWLPKNGVT